MNRSKRRGIFCGLLLAAQVCFGQAQFGSPAFISNLYPAGSGGGGTTNLSTGLIAYYRFEEAAGANNAIDATGNGRTLTQQASPGSAGGKLNNCRTYNGSSQYFIRADESALRFSGNFTVTAWINMGAPPGDMMVVGKDGASAGQREFDLIFKDSTSLMRADLLDQSGNVVSISCNTFGTLSQSVWYFVAVTRNGNTLSISINAGAQDQVSTSPTLTAPTGGTANWDVGARDNTGGQDFFNGSIDELAFYNRALSTTEITELFNSGAARDPVSNP